MNNILKIQIRKKLFLIPLIIIPFFIATKSYIIIFLLLQGRFFNVFQQADFQVHLYHITGSTLKKMLHSYNLSWGIWFNLWFILSQTIYLFSNSGSFQFIIIELIDFNIILFISFIIGNMLSNSDLITIKIGLLKTMAASFVFGTCISLAFALLKILTLLNTPIFIHLILLMIMVGIWQYYTKQQLQIKFIQYYL